MTASAMSGDVTEDAVLGGRLILRQPRKGHRVGHDAILLAAAAGGAAGDMAIDLGAGVGAAGLALATRVPGLKLALVEIDGALAVLACDNAKRNGLNDRVSVHCADATDRTALAAAGLGAGSAEHVLMNPPFNDPARQNLSPDTGRQLAHTATGGGLPAWVDSAARLLTAKGVLTLIWRADGLAEVLAAMTNDFGGITVLPVYPREGEAAIRVLVRGVKASRAGLSLLPGLLLAGPDGKPAVAAEAVLRGGEALPMLRI